MAETKTTAKAEPKAVKPAAKAAPAKAEAPATKPAAPAKAAAPKKANKDEMMQKHQQMVQFVQNMLGNIENDIKRIKLTLNQLAKFDPENPESVEIKDEHAGAPELKSYSEENVQVVEGKFDGYFMIGADQKKYPVPLNYSSKTKLVP